MKFNAERLTARRKASGIKQGVIAAKLAVSLSTYRRWEAGTGEPNASQFARLCQELDVGMLYLFESTGETTRVGPLNEAELALLLDYRDGINSLRCRCRLEYCLKDADGRCAIGDALADLTRVAQACNCKVTL